MNSKKRYLEIEEEIGGYRLRRGIPYPVTIVAVSKGIPTEEIQDVYQAGCRDFGESRVKEALEKKGELSPSIHWHMIGPLQTNKVPKAIGAFSLIESVDSPELLKEIHERSRKAGIITSVLLQANTSGEASKQGALPEEWEKIWDQFEPLRSIKIEGLMTIAPLTEDKEEIRRCFRRLRLLRENLILRAFPHTPLYHLSMGMSHDWRIALEEGATILRIGTAIFKSNVANL